MKTSRGQFPTHQLFDKVLEQTEKGLGKKIAPQFAQSGGVQSDPNFHPLCPLKFYMITMVEPIIYDSIPVVFHKSYQCRCHRAVGTELATMLSAMAFLALWENLCANLCLCDVITDL